MNVTSTVGRVHKRQVSKRWGELLKEITSTVLCREAGTLGHYFSLESCQSLSASSLILSQSFEARCESRPTISPVMLVSWVRGFLQLGGYKLFLPRVCRGYKGCVNKYGYPASQRWQSKPELSALLCCDASALVSTVYKARVSLPLRVLRDEQGCRQPVMTWVEKRLDDSGSPSCTVSKCVRLSGKFKSRLPGKQYLFSFLYNLLTK